MSRWSYSRVKRGDKTCGSIIAALRASQLAGSLWNCIGNPEPFGKKRGKRATHKQRQQQQQRQQRQQHIENETRHEYR
ncbi:hypothetical protein Trydic_g5285 [Trypoxylus dichotomus]